MSAMRFVLAMAMLLLRLVAIQLLLLLLRAVLGWLARLVELLTVEVVVLLPLLTLDIE